MESGVLGVARSTGFKASADSIHFCSEDSSLDLANKADPAGAMDAVFRKSRRFMNVLFVPRLMCQLIIRHLIFASSLITSLLGKGLGAY